MSPRHLVPSVMLALVLLLSACQSGGTPQGPLARLRSVNTAVQDELTQAIKDLSGVSQLWIDAGQLTQSATLTLERMGRKDANGVIMQGADRELPEVFQLRWVDGVCRIVQVRTGKSRVLRQADCEALP